jgi:methyl-accepting chemotaxis protein
MKAPPHRRVRGGIVARVTSTASADVGWTGRGLTGMTDLHRIAEQVADVADRIADVADALQGKGARRGAVASWLLLPAAGALAVFVARNGPDLVRQARELADRAKEQAASVGVDFDRVTDLLTAEGENDSRPSESMQRGTSSSAKERSKRSGRRQQRRKAS